MALRPSLMLTRAARRRCPVCGSGGLFRAWVFRNERCPRCGLRVVRVDGEVGALGLNVMVSSIAVCLAVGGSFAATAPEFDLVLISIVTLTTAVVVPVAFFPYSHTIWTALDLWWRPLDIGEVPPGFELEHERPRRAERDHDRDFHRRLERAVRRVGHRVGVRGDDGRPPAHR